MTVQRTDPHESKFQSDCELVPFPLPNRVGKIREVACKLLDRASDKAVAYYRKQISESIDAQFEKIGLPESERRRQITSFWAAVDHEMLKQSHVKNSPGGAA
ncbi:DUF6074 family protein [Sinorhizobium meliloti]|uniref:DUF6074 family protein n=1 Tax=Rhizobium meliloti TaxID=382 RepID=UPI00399A0AB8